jgi:hypothetical protein
MTHKHLSDRAIVILVALAVVAAAATFAQAMFMMPSDAPVDRLIANAEAYIKENPKDASGYYVAGRLHYLAWSQKTGLVPVYGTPAEGEAVKPNVPDDSMIHNSLHRSQQAEAQRRANEEYKIDSVRDLRDRDAKRAYWQRVRAIQQQLQKDGWKPEGLTEAQLDQHAEKAFHRFHQAIQLAPKNGLYHLSYGSLCEQYAARAGERGITTNTVLSKFEQINHDTGADKAMALDQILKDWQQEALTSYAKAFELSHKTDANLRHKPLKGIQSLVSHESATSYKRLVGEVAAEADKERIARMDAHIAQLQALPHGPVTPIVFTLDKHDGLADLLSNETTVTFDLNGTGKPQQWQWVKPNTGILVWDPGDRRQITSGRQLFGSVTWWLMPGDGYRAMDLLDDNRDGGLSGNELRGLAVWFDRNGDGLSGRGEVVPIGELPIAGLAVKAMSRDGRALMHPKGLLMTDGTTRPTYDWVAQPAE